MPAIVAVFLVAWLVVKAPRAIAEMVEDLRASKAGAWDHLADQRARRDASRVERREARRRAYAAAWNARRELRSRQAGGDGTYQPGMWAYLGDVYGGFWKRRIEVRRAKEAARPPYVHDPNRPPWHERVDATILGLLGRVGSAVRGARDVETVPAKPSPEPDPQPESQVEPVAATDLPPGTWTIGPDGQRVPLTEPDDALTRMQRGVQDARRAREATDYLRCPNGCRSLVFPGRDYCPQCLEGYTRRGQTPPPVAARPKPDGSTGYGWKCPRCGTEETGLPYEDMAQARRDLHTQACTPTKTDPNSPLVLPRTGEPRPEEKPMTAPTAPITVDEVTSNEALRRNFERMQAAAAAGQDALAAAEEALRRVEAARQEAAALAQASADGVAVKRFSAGATSAAHTANDALRNGPAGPSLADLSQLAEVFDGVQAAAASGHADLGQFVDSEELVAANNVDGSTLEPTAA